MTITKAKGVMHIPTDSKAQWIYQGIKWTVALVAGIWVDLPAAYQLLLTLMAVDITTGILASAEAGTLSAKNSFSGFVRKIVTLLMVWATHLVSDNLSTHMSMSFDIGPAVALSFTITEFLSIAENTIKTGVRLPPFVKTWLLKVGQFQDTIGSTTATVKQEHTTTTVETTKTSITPAVDPPKE